MEQRRKILIVSDYYEKIEQKISKATFVGEDIRKEFIKQGYYQVDISFINKPISGDAIKIDSKNSTIYLDVYNATTQSQRWESKILSNLYHQDIHVIACFAMTKALISNIPRDATIIHLGHIENHAYEKGVPLALNFCQRKI